MGRSEVVFSRSGPQTGHLKNEVRPPLPVGPRRKSRLHRLAPMRSTTGGPPDATPDRSHRISLDVLRRLAKFGFIANPVIEEFLLPEGAPFAMKNRIRSPSRDAFQTLENNAQILLGVQENGDVIAHHNVGM